jgi:hypothetical protein
MGLVYGKRHRKFCFEKSDFYINKIFKQKAHSSQQGKGDLG